LLEPIPEFVAPPPSDDDSVFEDIYEPPEEAVVFIDPGPDLEDQTNLNFDATAPAIIEPYMTYTPSTDKLSEYVPPPEEPEEELEKLVDKEDAPTRKDLMKILDEAGVEYKPKTRTTTLQKLVDGLAAEE